MLFPNPRQTFLWNLWSLRFRPRKAICDGYLPIGERLGNERIAKLLLLGHNRNPRVLSLLVYSGTHIKAARSCCCCCCFYWDTNNPKKTVCSTRLLYNFKTIVHSLSGLFDYVRAERSTATICRLHLASKKKASLPRGIVWFYSLLQWLAGEWKWSAREQRIVLFRRILWGNVPQWTASHSRNAARREKFTPDNCANVGHQ